MLIFLLKLITAPIGVWLGDVMLADIIYPNATAIVITGIFLAVVGYAVEWMALRRGTLWIITALDWGLSAAIVYGSQFVIRGAYVSWTGALLTAGILAVVEYFVHRYILKQGILSREM